MEHLGTLRPSLRVDRKRPRRLLQMNSAPGVPPRALGLVRIASRLVAPAHPLRPAYPPGPSHSSAAVGRWSKPPSLRGRQRRHRGAASTKGDTIKCILVEVYFPRENGLFPPRSHVGEVGGGGRALYRSSPAQTHDVAPAPPEVPSQHLSDVDADGSSHAPPRAPTGHPIRRDVGGSGAPGRGIRPGAPCEGPCETTLPVWGSALSPRLWK